ncbi:hypothetical protein Taro_034263 [Colocasia esculenta]|uniref:Uncharacterized protein n=1 Tax=Colocasia esculenta TaxID=4460 RepID=A0A843W9H0_COLES|nr:hypothetical protein [Colocasia esculenta]
METAKIKPIPRLRSRHRGPSQPSRDALPCRCHDQIPTSTIVAFSDRGGFRSNPSENHPKNGETTTQGGGDHAQHARKLVKHPNHP